MQIGYARVSTEDQNSNLQLDALEAVGCDKIFRDEGISGAATTRPGLDKALAALQSGDVLVVWRLDRLGRSLSHLITIIEDLGKRGIGFKSLSEAIDTTTASGELLFHIMGSLAHFERKLISERTKAGLQAAKKRGKRLGRPPALSQEQLNHAVNMIRSGQETSSGMADIYGVDRTTLYRALKS
ncbi:MAG: recombinase family protein [Proteobacteria bacterium]|nr:recombinase family protein [Pseudomonadota bacterium]